MPPDAEARIGEFSALVGLAIANVQAHADLEASRARVVAASDETRRQIMRDVHDGAQQRLVQTVLTLKLARQALERGDADLEELVDAALYHAEEATVALRELVHGILPPVLTRGGLEAAVDSLVTRMPIPVEVDVDVGRFPPRIEATAYFVVAEALTNVVKHARARRATVGAQLRRGRLDVEVRDDGIGGAHPHGTGLVGLTDRLDVLGGTLRVESRPEGGTVVAASIPVS